MNKKNILTIGVVALIAVLAVAGASAAWLTSSASADNSMTPATVEIMVVEENFTPPGAVQEGTVIDKDVSVTNLETGSDGRPGTYAYIRVAIVPVWRNADDSGTGLPVNNIQLNVLIGQGSKWFKHGDYYYYEDPVPPGETTEKLLDSYEVTSLSPEYEGKKLEINILASAIQAIGDAKYDWLKGLSKETVDAMLTSYEDFIARSTEPQP
ncbi:MAG: hypothetical protein ACOYIR_04550 [Christensenellales bacterium]|jgi:hypothetical protein